MIDREPHKSQEIHSSTHASGEAKSFDELARELANGTVSRRKVLRILSGALVGGMLTSVPGAAWAARGGNSACAKFCRENFSPGRERGECISAGARGEGPASITAVGTAPTGVPAQQASPSVARIGATASAP